MKGIVVLDNLAAGAAIGGVRMSPGVTVEEVCRLARTMTFKSAAAGLPHGGGKAGIVGNPDMGSVDKERIVRSFARAIAELTDYIPGPDMGTDETSMAFIYDEIGRAVGLPRVIGGIPLDEIGATGFGLAVCAEVAQTPAGIELSRARVAIQGFGNVGRHAARFLAERGATIVAVSDSRGGVVNLEGIDLAALLAHKAGGQSVRTFTGGKAIAGAALISVPCEIWVPAAQPDVIDATNAGELTARLVVCGANIPVTPEAEAVLHERGVLVIPDFIANAGGLICAAVEYRGGTQSQAFAAIEDKIVSNTAEVLERAAAESALPRHAAHRLAEQRVREAMSYRRAGYRSAASSNLLDL